MSAHTPGPWRLDPKLYRGEDGGNHAYLEVGSTLKAFWIAKVQTFDDDPGEYAANARLIEAAPELLQALRIIRDSAYASRLRNLKKVVIDSIKIAECAIAKAEVK